MRFGIRAASPMRPKFLRMRFFSTKDCAIFSSQTEFADSALAASGRFAAHAKTPVRLSYHGSSRGFQGGFSIVVSIDRCTSPQSLAAAGGDPPTANGCNRRAHGVLQPLWVKYPRPRSVCFPISRIMQDYLSSTLAPAASSFFLEFLGFGLRRRPLSPACRQLP